ncbi:bck1-like resistance to osmotic shock, partial [Spiromyces aspiralis]
ATYQRLAQIQQERQAVMADFKRKVHEERDDEVIERLLSYDMRGQHQSENREKLFAQSLEKFQPYTHRLQALNSKQVLLLKQFTTEFRELMDSASARLVQKQWDAAEILRNQFSEMLLSAIHSYHELVDTARKAIEFYRQLSESTTDLHVRTTQFVESRTMERSAMIKKIEDNKSLSEHVALKKRLEQYKVLPSAPSEHGSANGSNNGSTYVDERRDVATSYYSSASIPIALTAPTAPGADIATLGSSDLPSSS